MLHVHKDLKRDKDTRGKTDLQNNAKNRNIGASRTQQAAKQCLAQRHISLQNYPQRIQRLGAQLDASKCGIFCVHLVLNIGPDFITNIHGQNLSKDQSCTYRINVTPLRPRHSRFSEPLLIARPSQSFEYHQPVIVRNAGRILSEPRLRIFP